MNENTEPNLQTIFDQELTGSFIPEELPGDWTVGQHTYYRVREQEGALSAQLMYFRDNGVKVLDFDRRWGFWIFKTMASQPAS